MGHASDTPPDKVQVALRDGVIWVELRGEISFNDSLRAMKAASEAARRHVTDRLIFDIRGTHHPEFHAVTLESARMAPDIGLNTALRCAILGDEKDRPRLDFIEDVAANRGFKARAFTDEAQALAWLKAGRA